MRWIHEPHVPVLGEHRVCTKFLWGPRRIGNETRWLEWSTWIEVFKQDGYDRDWVPVRWEFQDEDGRPFGSSAKLPTVPSN
jgi:hypothetical protein